jgi:hypothetical protein
MELIASMLRSTADQAGVAPLREIAKQPFVSAAYRLIIRYHDRRAADSIATLRRIGRGEVLLEVVYRALFNHKPLAFRVEQERYDALVASLHSIRFDAMKDQLNIPTHGVDLWMIERAAGNFVKSVILAPELATDTHARLMEVVKVHLPEAVREVRS